MAKAGFSYDWHKAYDENYDSGPFCNLAEDDWKKIDSFRKENASSSVTP
ncbi:hypothetical protein J4220_03435 [Candidatus Micrarchaeota archaeon]|nr:hypothetical protein [Candidatus Micrarchaeota archaeon]